MMLALAGLWGAHLLVQGPAELRWQAPAGCPDEVAVRGTIERRLGRALAAGEATVAAEVVRVGREFRLALRLAASGRSEVREVVDVSCAALAEVVALRVAAAVETVVVPAPPGGEVVAVGGVERDDGVGVGSDVERGPQVDVGARAEVGDAVEPGAGEVVAVEAERARGSSRPGGVVRVQGGGEVGVVPGVTGAVGLAGGLLWRRVRVELQGVYLAARTTTRAGASLQASMLAGSLHVCARRGRGAIEAPLCGGLELGAVRGTARGVAGARTATGLLVAVMVGQGVVWHVNRRVSVWGALQLVVAPRVPRFEISNEVASRRLFGSSPVSGRLLLGVELRIGDPW